MDGGWINHTWGMVVVSHSYVGLGGSSDGGGGW